MRLRKASLCIAKTAVLWDSKSAEPSPLSLQESQTE